MICHILIFLEVVELLLPRKTGLTLGKYALVHFVNEDVFGDCPKSTLYGTEYDSFLIDGNCELVRGWAKKTNLIGSSQAITTVQEKRLRPSIGIIPVTQLLDPVVGIPDTGNDIPYSYLFLPSR